MLSISGINNIQYYADLATEDYYQAGGEPPGQWLGQGCAALGLSGQVQGQEYRRLFAGFDPHEGQDKPLVQNAGAENRRPGWDFCFSAPKSISTVWSQADQETRQQIQQAQAKAVRAALAHLENCAIARRGKAGAEAEHCKIVAASYEHSTSRTQDPQLHTHCLVANLAIRPDGTTGTLEPKEMYAHKMAAGAIYRAELAREMQQMGFAVERENDSFRLAGSPKALEKEFSKRRAEIEAALEEKGFSGAKASEVAALDTREKKESRPRSELFEEWQEVGREFGFDLETVKTAEPEEPPKMPSREELLFQLTERQSTFKEADVYKTVAIAAQGVHDAAEIRQYVVDLQNSPEMIRLQNAAGEGRWTTREMLRLEKQMVSTSETLAARQSHQVTPEALEARAAHGLSDKQDKAFHHITSPAQLSCLIGYAGTGKSRLLGAAKQAWESQGFEVRGAALASIAVRGLQDKGIEAQTLHSLLRDIDNGDLKLTSKTVLIIDEAGMIGSRQMSRLTELSEQSGSKLVLVGDPSQLQAIDAGGAYQAIIKKTGAYELDEIRRQKEAWARQATLDFQAGKAAEALAAYHQRDCLHVSEDRQDAMKQMVDGWRQAWRPGPIDDKLPALMLAATRAEVAELNSLAREKIASEGRLGPGAEIQTEGYGKLEFREGDRILFTRPSRQVDVDNGSLATIKTMIPSRDGQGWRITAELDGGRRVSFDSNKYAHVTHGYCVTTHKSQGVTVQNAFVLGGGSMVSREMAYVQMSRHEESAHLYLNKKEVIDTLKSQNPESEPTQKMLALAESIANQNQIDLTDDIKQNFWACRQFLNENAYLIDGNVDNKSITKFDDIKEIIKQMSTAQQKDTTLDYDIVNKENKEYNNLNKVDELFEQQEKRNINHHQVEPEPEKELEMEM